MAAPRIRGLAISLLWISVVDLGPALTAGTHQKRSIQYTFQRTLPTQYWRSGGSPGLLADRPPAQYWTSGAPTGVPADRPLLMDSGALGAFSGSLDSPFMTRVASPAVAMSPKVPGLEPMVTYLPLPALMAALRGMSPAAAATGVGPVPTICVHAHPAAPAPPTDPAAPGAGGGGALLVPGVSDAAQTQILRMLLGQLLPAASVLATRTAAVGGAQQPAVSHLSTLRDLGLGLLNPALFRPGGQPRPTGHDTFNLRAPPRIPETDVASMADAERTSVTERPGAADANPDAESFTRQDLSSPSASASADSDAWTNFLRIRRRKRSTPRAGRSDARQQMATALSKIIHRIGFEKYGESLRVILQDLQPLKEAMRATQSDLNSVQSTYKKFETDLNNLLEQTRAAQQILLFILSSLFKENLLTRRKLEECEASNQVLITQLRFPSRGASEIDTLRGQLEVKMRQYDALVITLLEKKSALEVERRQLQRKCNIRISSGGPGGSGGSQPDPFSLSTFLSLMTGLGEPSGAQRNVNVLLMRLFPDLYPQAPPPPPQSKSKILHAGPGDAGDAGGSGGGWLQVLVPMLNVRHGTRPFSVPVSVPQRGADLPFSFSPPFVFRHPASAPLAGPVTHQGARVPLQGQSANGGDEFAMRMLHLMLQLYNAKPGRLDDSKVKGELVNFGRQLLC